MVDRGSIAEKALIKSGLNKGYVADRLNIDRRTLYNKLKRPDLELDFIIDLYKVLRIDVTEDFPQLGKYVFEDESVESLHDNQSNISDFNKCKMELEKLKDKYIKLLEEYNNLLLQNQDLLARQNNRID